MRYQLLFIIFTCTAALMAQNYPKAYAELDRLTEKGQYKSALEVADSIYSMAEKAGQADEQIRALDRRLQFTEMLSEEGEQSALDLLKGVRAKAKNQPVVATLTDILISELYFNYARNNSYRLRNQTEIAAATLADGTPLAELSLGQLLESSREHLYRGLAAARVNRTALGAISAIISGGKDRIAEVPTLYDLLVDRAMLVLGSTLGSVTDDTPLNPATLLVSAVDYCNLDLSESYDTTKGTPRKLMLYQEWISYHLDEASPALLYADLERMKFVHRSGAADSLYLPALQSMYDRYAGNPLRDRILVEMATVLDRDDDELGLLPRVRALELLRRVGDQDEFSRVSARQLRGAITAPRLESRALDFYPRNQQLLVSVTYRNIARLYYRVYRYDAAAGEQLQYRAGERLKQVMQGDVVADGSFVLKENDDYGTHTSEINLAALPPGAYRLVVADDDRFSAGGSSIAIAEFQVSDLAVIRVTGDNNDGFVQVVDRSTGAAVPGVNVQVREEERRGGYRQIATRKSDAEGKLTLPTSKRYNNYQLILTHGETEDRLVFDTYAYEEREDNGRTDRYTTLLTDRNIYRPGQTVMVYGLHYETDPDQLPTVVSGEKVTVILRDANYQEVAQQAATSDEYGRFHLNFTLPDGGLTGQFTLQTAGGSAIIKVEEYKRPRFEAAIIQARDVTAGETVTINGTALTYAGPPVADARVSYRVFVEEMRWGYYFYRGGGNGERELLFSGTTDTDEAGDFSFEFTAPNSPTANRYRRLRYVVEADVADQTGETHMATASFGRASEKPAVAVMPDQELLDMGKQLTIDAITDNPDTTLEITLTIVPVDKTNAALTEREWAIPDRPIIDRETFEREFPNLAYAAVPELSAWLPSGDVVFASSLLITQGKGRIILPAEFRVGHYRIDWLYADGTKGEPATFAIYDGDNATLPSGVLYVVEGITDTAVVDEPIEVRLLSAIDLPLVFGKWQSRKGDHLERAAATRTASFTYLPTEADRGGLYFATAFVTLNNSYRENYRIALPWDNKELTATYATFRDKLRPGEPERWTVKLRSADSTPVSAAALATMYDASLDQLFAGQGWQFSPYPQFYGARSLADGGSFGSLQGWSSVAKQPVADTLPDLPTLLLTQFADLGTVLNRKENRRAYMSAAPQDMMEASAAMEESPQLTSSPVAPPPPPLLEADRETEDSAPIQIRKNLKETAFWLPDLTAAADGSLQISFTSPEALTAWKFRLFAHDRSLNYTISDREIVTQKELMVLPNVPRFVREGDRIELTTRVSNMTESEMPVTVELELFNPVTLQPLDPSVLQSMQGGADAGAKQFVQSATLAGSASETLRFSLSIPEGASVAGPLGYRIVARGGEFSDGEENVIPVLSDRTLITESVPFYLRGGESKKVTVPGLALHSVDPSSPHTLTPVSYTFQATTNPAWLALKALPYLMEYPYDCTEQLANRYFANQLAYATVSTKPVLEKVFRKWRSDSTALLGELEKNQELKNALLTETPWVREAQSETAQRARIGELFQLKRLATEQQQNLDKLAARQESDGAYSWFPGGRSNRYMTQYVVETIARMTELGVIPVDQKPTTDRITERAIRYLDQQLDDDYERLFARTKDSVKLREDYVPNSSQIHYLYARAMSGVKATENSKALEFFRERALAEWTGYGLYEQALIALMGGEGGASASKMIITSLRERALHSDEFGMYWKYERGYRWNQLPIETHTRLIEAFQKIDPQQEELDEMRLWLLTNKRTNAWPTTKATAAAVFAILNTGETYVAADNVQPIEARWAGRSGKELGTRVRALQTEGNAEAATGEFSVRVDGEDVSNDLATVRVKNPGNDLVWGGVFWQYTEIASKVKASADGPLSLERKLYKKAGDQLLAITESDPLSPGDRVTVRITLRSDRDLDYVHLKDRRAAAFEPVDPLSTYRYQNGLGYYFAPGDLATNFFIDDLPKGTYVLEYDLFVTYAGSFSSGLSRVQCMYAPEFGANSEGSSLLVR